MIRPSLPVLLLALATLCACSDDGADGESSAAVRRAGQTLYVLNSRANDTTVIDVATNELVGFIKTGRLPHGLAAPASQDRLYIANEGGKHGLVVVDPASGEVIERHEGFGDRPGEIEVTPNGKFVYVPAKGDGLYRVFDTRTRRIVAAIPTDGQPHNVVVTPDSRYMVLASMDGGDIPVEKLREAGLPTSENEKVYVVETRTHSVVATIDCGGTPRTIAISPDGARLYANLDDLLGFVVLDLVEHRLLERVEFDLTEEERAVPSRSHGIVVTPDGRELWSIDVNHELIHVFDLGSEPPRQVARIPTGELPLWMAVTPDGRTVYVSNTGEDSISAFDTATREEVARIQLPEGKAPRRMQVLDVPAPR
ncbi:MAG: beta-propeller fold lactonase family protein [Planctomycetota bacterium]